MTQGGNGQFPNTRWTLLQRLKAASEEMSRRALEELCTQYRYPLYCYIRRFGVEHHDAEDVLHDFLAKLLRLNSFKGVEAQKGRLRSFLMRSLGRFVSNWHRDQSPVMKGAVSMDVALLEERYQRERFSDGDTPERIFDRKWSQELLRRAMKTLEKEYVGKERGELFQALRPVLLNGGSLRGESGEELAARLTMTDGALRVALSRMLKDFRRVVEEEVLQTVEGRDAVQREIASLISQLGKG